MVLFHPLLAQFDGERRRSDQGPLSLPGGSSVEFKSFDSECLGMPAHYSVYLPPSYSENLQRAYPVIYFLHGLNNDETSWTVDRYGRIQDKIETLMIAGKIPEFIMVHPRGDNGFYCNYLDGTRRYEDFITQELIEYIEKSYRVRKGRESRAIAGTSMGGYGALKIVMKFPGSLFYRCRPVPYPVSGVESFTDFGGNEGLPVLFVLYRYAEAHIWRSHAAGCMGCE